MKWQSLTWPQVCLALGSVGLIIAAYKLLGPNAAAIVTVVTHLLTSAGAKND